MISKEKLNYVYEKWIKDIDQIFFLEGDYFFLLNEYKRFLGINSMSINLKKIIGFDNYIFYEGLIFRIPGKYKSNHFTFKTVDFYKLLLPVKKGNNYYFTLRDNNGNKKQFNIIKIFAAIELNKNPIDISKEDIKKFLSFNNC